MASALQCMQNLPVELREEARLRFAASSREYVLRCSTSAEGSAAAVKEQSSSAALGGMKRSAHSEPEVLQESQVPASLGLHAEQVLTCHDGSIVNDCAEHLPGEEAKGSEVG